MHGGEQSLHNSGFLKEITVVHVPCSSSVAASHVSNIAALFLSFWVTHRTHMSRFFSKLAWSSWSFSLFGHELSFKVHDRLLHCEHACHTDVSLSLRDGTASCVDGSSPLEFPRTSVKQIGSRIFL